MHFERLDGLWLLLKPKSCTVPRLCRRSAVPFVPLLMIEFADVTSGQSVELERAIEETSEGSLCTVNKNECIEKNGWIVMEMQRDELIVWVRRFVFGEQGSPSAAQRPGNCGPL